MPKTKENGFMFMNKNLKPNHSNMKAIIAIATVLFFTCVESKGQTQSIYAELGGQSVLYSINYEYKFAEKNKKALFLRGGIMAIPTTAFAETRVEIGMPLEAGYVLGEKNHHFEVSTSIFMITEAKNTNLVGSTNQPSGGTTMTYLWMNRIGYRYQKPDGHFLFRAGFTPVNARLNFAKTDNFLGFFPHGGICLGYTF
jgi:hypothetical protein